MVYTRLRIQHVSGSRILNIDMLLISHIIIALASITLSVYLMLRPQPKLLRVSYALIGLTLATGTVLILNGANVLHTCLRGLVYCLIVTGATEVARRRLVALRSLVD